MLPGARRCCQRAGCASPLAMRQTAANQARSFWKFCGVRADRMQSRQRVGNSVLAKIVAGRHLSAKTVAAMQDRHLRGIVGRRLHEHRNIEPRQSQRVGNRALVAEVGQRHDHAIDLVADSSEIARRSAWLLRGFRLRRACCLPDRERRNPCRPWPAPGSFLRVRTSPTGREKNRGSR